MKTKFSILVVVALFLAACGAKSAPTPAGTLPPIPVTGQTDVTIQSFAFSPAQVTIKVGDTVKWTNQDSVGHTVVADDNSWQSNLLNQGDSYTQTFSAAGTYSYHCSVHPNMKGTITVVAQ